MKCAETGEVCSLSQIVAPKEEATRPVVNVWMIDNQHFFQEAVATALQGSNDFVLGGCFVHPEDALLDDDGTKAPDIILMDIREFGRDDGIKWVGKLRAVFELVHLIILTDSIEEALISDAVCAGAAGYLLKTSPLEKILESIREIISGGASLDPAVTRSVLEMFRRLSGTRQKCGLTVQELRILNLMGQGLALKEMAQQLAISYHTVDTHSRNIYAKLGVHS